MEISIDALSHIVFSPSGNFIFLITLRAFTIYGIDTIYGKTLSK